MTVTSINYLTQKVRLIEETERDLGLEIPVGGQETRRKRNSKHEGKQVEKRNR